MDSITCPHCGKKVEISKALQNQLLETRLEEEKKVFEQRLETVKKETEDRSSQKAKEFFELQLKRLTEDNSDKEERIKRLIDQMDGLTQELRSSKKEREEIKLEMQKKLVESEEKIRADAQKKAEEEQHLKILEKDKQLESALKEVEDMRRKLQQGSQQTQGEAFELEFEETLKREFPNDKIEEVAKGTRGGDLIQEVWDKNGNYCGKILWELKNTKTWSEQWIDKLKTDQRNITADFAVIISEVVPQDIDSAKFYKNVWVAKRNFVIGLAGALRLNVIQISLVKRAQEGKKEKMDILHSYLTGIEFRLRMEAIVEAFTGMQQEIEKEKRYFNNKWARDEKNIRQVIDNTYGMHGDLKGIMGKAIGEIKGLDTLELDSGQV